MHTNIHAQLLLPYSLSASQISTNDSRPKVKEALKTNERTKTHKTRATPLCCNSLLFLGINCLQSKFVLPSLANRVFFIQSMRHIVEIIVHFLPDLLHLNLPISQILLTILLSNVLSQDPKVQL